MQVSNVMYMVNVQSLAGTMVILLGIVTVMDKYVGVISRDRSLNMIYITEHQRFKSSR